ARSIVAPAVFEPATAFGCFTISTIDHMALLLMPTLIANLTKLAPGLDLKIPPPSGDNVDLVAQGGVDLAIGVYEQLPASLYCRSLYDEDLVCIVRRGHPVIAKGLTLDHYTTLLHLLVIIDGQGGSIVDAALAQCGLSRRVAVRLPHFLAAAMFVAESDMILSIPRRLAHRLAMSTQIEVLELPLDTGSFTLSMIWHERQQDDPAHMWLRKQIVNAVE
ncbi:MAG: LysR substrate-binding domain-containing protein, partial [Sneathiella sp.]